MSSRIMSAAIEQSHDADGIIWPLPIAPFQVVVLPLNSDQPDVVEAGLQIYEGLQARGVDVLLDDRAERPGRKFKDADLIGVPLRVTIGKRGLAEGHVECKSRGQAEIARVPVEGVVEWVLEQIERENSRFLQ